MAVNANDAQLIEQLKWTAETVCSCFHVQPYMVSIGPPPPYANIEPLNLQYDPQCLQALIENLELCLDEGLESRRWNEPKSISTTCYGWTANENAFGADRDHLRRDGVLRSSSKYFDLGPTLRDTPYMQQQMWPLNQLANRAIPEIPPPPGQAAPPAPPADDEPDDADVIQQWRVAFATLLHAKAIHGDRMRPDDVATAVVLEMKSVLAPVYERLAVIETTIQQSGLVAELLVTREVAGIGERLPRSSRARRYRDRQARQWEGRRGRGRTATPDPRASPV